jgi:hypothetical protein
VSGQFVARLHFSNRTIRNSTEPDRTRWIDHVRDALNDTYPKYPFIAYGTDWLAYAHIVIAIAFIGPFRDPVRNIWIVQWAMIACVLVIPLIVVYRLIRRLERENAGERDV